MQSKFTHPGVSCSGMKLCVFTVLTFALSVWTENKIVHEIIAYNGCSDAEDEDVWGIDGDEEYHTDFSKERGVMTLPDFASYYSDLPGAYDRSVHDLPICKRGLIYLTHLYNFPAEDLNPPDTSIYPKDDVQLGVENKLICLVTGFFPPPVRVLWTKNAKNVTENIHQSQSYPNNEYLFTLFSTLNIIPEQGDIYTCTVDHRALQRPQTRIWEIKVDQPGDGSLVFCGVGVAAGLLGITGGTFFFIKGKNYS